jgi:two-component system, cell cycle response regulator
MPARILVIEDNADNLHLMTYLLRAFGHVPLSASDGEEGLAVARREQPDLILCDIQLADMDGYAVAHAAKDDSVVRSIPLVAVTALAMMGDRDKVLAAGFVGYISKPITPESFVAQVEEFLPAALRSAGPTRAAPVVAATTPAPPRRGVILITDDHPVNLALKRSILEPVGYVVRTASGMQEALALARDLRPDLIISDVRMADGHGFDFIRALHADPRLQGVPLIFITSTYCDEATRDQGLALGAKRVLFRPLESEVLLAEIEACLRETRGR